MVHDTSNKKAYKVISYLHREGSAGDGEDGAVEEIGAELLRVQRGRRYHQPEVLPPLEQVLCVIFTYIASYFMSRIRDCRLASSFPVKSATSQRALLQNAAANRMNITIGCPDAAWLPSRAYLSIFMKQIITGCTADHDFLRTVKRHRILPPWADFRI